MTQNGGGPIHDPEGALRPLKLLPLWQDEIETSDADDDERKLVRKVNESRGALRAAELLRWNAGRFYMYEAAALIGAQRGLNAHVQEVLCGEMRCCAALPDNHRHKLILRDPSTFIPVQHGVRISMAHMVYRSDVNEWLDATGAGYRWEGNAPETAATSGADTDQRVKRKALIERHEHHWPKIAEHLVGDNYLGRRVASRRNVTRRLVVVLRSSQCESDGCGPLNSAVRLFGHSFFGSPPQGPPEAAGWAMYSWFNPLSAASTVRCRVVRCSRAPTFCAGASNFSRYRITLA